MAKRIGYSPETRAALCKLLGVEALRNIRAVSLSLDDTAVAMAHVDMFVDDDQLPALLEALAADGGVLVDRRDTISVAHRPRVPGSAGPPEVGGE